MQRIANNEVNANQSIALEDYLNKLMRNWCKKANKSMNTNLPIIYLGLQHV